MWKRVFCVLVVLLVLCGNVNAQSASKEAIVTLGESQEDVTEKIGPPDVVVFSGKSDSGKDKEVWLYEKFIDNPVRRLDATKWAFAVDYDWDVDGSLSDPFFDPGDRIAAEENLAGSPPAPLDEGYLFTFIDDKLVDVKKQM